MESRRLKRTLSSLTTQINGLRENSFSPGANTTTTGKKRRQNPNIASNDVDMIEEGMVELKDWCQKYEPDDTASLVLHQRKLQDVRKVLEPMINGNSMCRILLLTGPAGTSKSSCIKTLARELIQDPADKRSGSHFTLGTRQEHQSYIEYDGSNVASGVSKVDHFDQFLAEAKYRVGPNVALVLIEDLPNLFHESTRIQFQQALLRWLCSPQPRLPPLIISLTECEIHCPKDVSYSFGIDTQFIAETVLGSEVLNHQRLRRIKFNPINKTLLKKHLKAICDNERKAFKPGRWEQKDEFISSIAENCGDLRSAISALQLWATTSGPASTFSSTREQSISYFQGLGRVLHGSKDVPNDNRMIKELMLSQSAGTGELLKMGILENYATFCKGQFSLTHAASILESLSLGDIMTVESMSTNTLTEAVEFPLRAVRHTFASLGKGTSSSHHKPNFPRESKVRKLRNKFVTEAGYYASLSIRKYRNWPRMGNIALYFSYYAPLIRKQLNYKRKYLQHYLDSLGSDSERKKAMSGASDLFIINEQEDVLNRIGGELSSISASSDVVPEENDGIFEIRPPLVVTHNANDPQAIKDDHQMFTDEENDTNDEEVLDPIDESASEADSFSFSDEDDPIYDMLASQSPRKTNPPQ
ncbi:LAFA_0E06194g1_1 [Lachancea sp. 'fantastica']|nr:LAFA_0E06194g1_1 [Lachancea sp. 'fantastica']